MGQDNDVPRRINRVEGALGQVMVSGGPGVLESWQYEDYPHKLLPNLVRWVIPGWYAPAIATILAVANRIYYIPIFVEETTTYIRIGCVVTVGVAGTAGLRIYEWNNGVPGALILDAGNVDITAAAAKEIVIAQQLTRGYYFLAIRPTAAATFSTTTATAVNVPVAGINTGHANAAVGWVIMFVNAAYADPAPAPTGIGIPDGAPSVQLREN